VNYSIDRLIHLAPERERMHFVFFSLIFCESSLRIRAYEYFEGKLCIKEDRYLKLKVKALENYFEENITIFPQKKKFLGIRNACLIKF